MGRPRVRRKATAQFKLARQRAHLTQGAAAELLRVSIWTLRNWEQRRREAPPFAMALLLLKTAQYSVKSYEPPAADQPGRLLFVLENGERMAIAVTKDQARAVVRAIER